MYTTDKVLHEAIEYVQNWISLHGNKQIKPASVMREQMKCMHDTHLSHESKMYRVAALSLFLSGLDINAPDIAWLVREIKLGFPEAPSFDF